VRELGIIVAAVFFAYIRAVWAICTEYMLATAPQGKPPPLFLSSSFDHFVLLPLAVAVNLFGRLEQ
jgi:hypothetical protein